MTWLSKRVIEPEELDHADPEEARENLADLVRLNRTMGGHGVIGRLLAKVAEKDDFFSLLDVGAASGDTGQFIRSRYPRARVTSLDLHEVNLGAAPEPKLIADAFHLPFPENSFDFVLTSLFLHHFADEQVVSLLRGFQAIARRAVLIADLERHPIAYWFLPVTKPLFGWHKISVADGMLSVQAGFRARELTKLAEAAGLINVTVAKHRPAFRISLVAKKSLVEVTGGHSEEDTHRSAPAAIA